MKICITRIIFAIFCSLVVLLPLLPKEEIAEHPFADEIRWRSSLDENGGRIYIFFNTDGEICRLPYNSARSGVTEFQHDFSLNRQYVAVISGRDSFDGGGNLYRVDGEGCSFVADNVFHGLISDDGKTLAYIRYNEDGSTGSLYLYDHTRGNARLIDNAVSISHQNARFAVSPDGGTVVYCRAEGEDFTGMVWSDGETRTLGRNVFPIAASDGMEHLYYAEPVDADDPQTRYSLYVQHKEKKSLLVENARSLHVYFNRNFTEALYTFRTQVLAENGNVHRLSYSPKDIAEPYVNFYYESQYNPYRTYAESYTRQNIDSYKNLRVYGGENIGVINDDYTFTPIIDSSGVNSGVGQYQFSSLDNSVLYLGTSFSYLPHTTLYYRSATEEREISDMVENFAASPDLSEIYLQTLDGELYYTDLDSGEPHRVAENAKLPNLFPYSTEINTKSWYSVYRNPGIFIDGKCFFTDADQKTLYFSQKGDTPREVLSVESGHLWFCWLGDKLLIANSYPTENDLNAVRYYLFENNTAVPFADDV